MAPKTLYNRWKHRSITGVFARMMEGPFSLATTPKTVMIDATNPTAQRMAIRLGPTTGGSGDRKGRLIGRMRRKGQIDPGDRLIPQRGGRNAKLHAVTDAESRLIRFHMTAGQVRDYSDAASLLGRLPKADRPLTDRGYDADWFRDALKDNGIRPCIPGRKSRGRPVKHDKRRNRIDIMFGRLKDWRAALPATFRKPGREACSHPRPSLSSAHSAA